MDNEDGDTRENDNGSANDNAIANIGSPDRETPEDGINAYSQGSRPGADSTKYDITAMYRKKLEVAGNVNFTDPMFQDMPPPYDEAVRHDPPKGFVVVRDATSDLQEEHYSYRSNEDDFYRRNEHDLYRRNSQRPPDLSSKQFSYPEKKTESDESLGLGNAVFSRLATMERSVTETRQVANQTHQLQQTMNQRMERIEQHLQQRQPQPQTGEGSLGQCVDERLEQNLQFRSIEETRTRAMITDNRTEVTHTSHRCERCNCMKRCSCDCHLKEKWKREGVHDKPCRGKDGSAKCVQSLEVRRNYFGTESDLHSSNDFENNFHDVSDSDCQTPTSEKKNKKWQEMSNVTERESEDGVFAARGASGGNPPSDDPSGDDDSEDERKDKDNMRKLSGKRKKTNEWVIDSDAWAICVEHAGDFEDQASNLLKQKKLPNQAVLNAACSKYTRSSPVLKKICKCVCRFIKEKSEIIVHVWAAYTYRKDNMVYGNEIVFVVLTTHNDIIGEKDFSIHQRCILEVKNKEENMIINEKELDTSNRPSATEMQDLKACLKENAKTWMKEHSELTRVTAGWYRACVNDTGQYSLQKQLCIVLYIHVKGYVPLNEKPFPTQIGKYPVDVREGIFTLCRGPNDYHENLKMGCAVRGESQGTLGAFIEFENDVDLYGITCAHVVFGNEKLKWIIEHGQVNYPNSETGETVYQPASQTFIAPFGKTVMALYDEGGNGGPGMEIALIKIIQNRWPTEGTFPDDSSYRQKDLDLTIRLRFVLGRFGSQTAVFIRL